MAEQEIFDISPEQYQALLRSVQLHEVSLDSVSATCERQKLGKTTATVKLESSSSIELEDGFSHILMHYKMGVLQGEADVVNISATYRLTLATPQRLPEAFFKVFQQFNLRVSTMPYLRELVASLTGRMELPTLTLPYEVPGLPDPQNDAEPIPAVKTPTRKKKSVSKTE